MQLAKAQGAYVITTASAASADFLKACLAAYLHVSLLTVAN